MVNSVFTASFLGTIRDQVDRNFASDFTVQAIGGGLETPVPIGPDVRRQIAALPGAAVVAPLRSRFVKLPGTTHAPPTGSSSASTPSSSATSTGPRSGARAAPRRSRA